MIRVTGCFVAEGEEVPVGGTITPPAAEGTQDADLDEALRR